MKKFVQRLFPTRPVLGISLVSLLLLQGAILASTPIVIMEKAAAAEGDWLRNQTVPISGGFRCKYTRQTDRCIAASWWPWDGRNNIDCVAKPVDQGGHHQLGYKDIQPGGECPAKELTDKELTDQEAISEGLVMEGSPSLQHYFEQARQ
ncbi:MAG: hypothetical protein OHK0029_33340 [Armatimonadaceae bacterium]